MNSAAFQSSAGPWRARGERPTCAPCMHNEQICRDEFSRLKCRPMKRDATRQKAAGLVVPPERPEHWPTATVGWLPFDSGHDEIADYLCVCSGVY